MLLQLLAYDSTYSGLDIIVARSIVELCLAWMHQEVSQVGINQWHSYMCTELYQTESSAIPDSEY